MDARSLAGRVLDRVRPLGQETLSLIGDPGRTVSRLGVGTGAITHVPTLVEMGADVVLATDDGMSFWRDGCWAEDLGVPVIVVNHATAEIWGVRNLAAYLGEMFPGVRVEYLGTRYVPWSVG